MSGGGTAIRRRVSALSATNASGPKAHSEEKKSLHTSEPGAHEILEKLVRVIASPMRYETGDLKRGPALYAGT